MKLPISPRLLACCDYVNQNDCVADIGCDHGYLGIHLLLHGIASRVIAADINEGPLQSAVINAEKFGVRDTISFYLSDGAVSIPRDFDTMVCAGMGADVMISILEKAPWLRSSSYRLVLQCQSRTHQLRKYLGEQGWQIRRERVLKDGRFLYTVMEVIYGGGSTLSPGQCYVSSALLENKDAFLAEYCRRMIGNLRIAINGQGQNADPAMKAALDELLTTLPPELKEESL